MLLAGILILVFYAGLSILVVREMKKAMKRENTLEMAPLKSQKRDVKTDQ